MSYYQINKLTFVNRPCVFVQLYCLTSFLILVSFSCGSVAHFLESRGMLEEALEIATDADYKFDLAVQLGKLDVAKVLNILSLMFFFQ